VLRWPSIRVSFLGYRINGLCSRLTFWKSVETSCEHGPWTRVVWTDTRVHGCDKRQSSTRAVSVCLFVTLVVWQFSCLSVYVFCGVYLSVSVSGRLSHQLCDSLPVSECMFSVVFVCLSVTSVVWIYLSQCVCFLLCLSVCLSHQLCEFTCLSVYLFCCVCLSVCHISCLNLPVSVCMFSTVSVCLSVTSVVWIYLSQCVCFLLCLSVCLSHQLCEFTCLSVYLFCCVCLSVCHISCVTVHHSAWW